MQALIDALEQAQVWLADAAVEAQNIDLPKMTECLNAMSDAVVTMLIDCDELMESP
ncbi:MAG: hypothetical protein AMXMBFR16_11410 [Candidatus Uhrbacteria bacterium]